MDKISAFPKNFGLQALESFCNWALTICFSWGSSDFGCGAEMMQCGVKEYLALKLLFNITNGYKDSI
jgi:hypothetical protein